MKPHLASPSRSNGTGLQLWQRRQHSKRDQPPLSIALTERFGRWQRLVITTVFAIVVPVVLTESFEAWAGLPENLEWLLHSVVLVAILVPAFYFLWYQPLTREMAERIRVEEEVRRLSRQVMEAGEEERRRLARDLHDDIGQKLIALQLQLDLHCQDLETRAPWLAEECRQIGGTLAGLSNDLRRVTAALRPPLLDDLGLLPALEAHLAELHRLRPTLDVKILASGISGRLPQELETTLFRVCQEALSNVIRHARAQQVQIRLTGAYRSTILIVEDDGIGFHAAPSYAYSDGEHHCGLSGIRERVAAVNGSFRLVTAPGKGTRLRVEVPLHG